MQLITDINSAQSGVILLRVTSNYTDLIYYFYRNYIICPDVCTEWWSTQSTRRTLTCQQFEQYECFDRFVPLTAFQVSTKTVRFKEIIDQSLRF